MYRCSPTALASPRCLHPTRTLGCRCCCCCCSSSSSSSSSISSSCSCLKPLTCFQTSSNGSVALAATEMTKIWRHSYHAGLPLPLNPIKTTNLYPIKITNMFHHQLVLPPTSHHHAVHHVSRGGGDPTPLDQLRSAIIATCFPSQTIFGFNFTTPFPSGHPSALLRYQPTVPLPLCSPLLHPHHMLIARPAYRAVRWEVFMCS